VPTVTAARVQHKLIVLREFNKFTELKVKRCGFCRQRCVRLPLQVHLDLCALRLVAVRLPMPLRMQLCVHLAPCLFLMHVHASSYSHQDRSTNALFSLQAALLLRRVFLCTRRKYDRRLFILFGAAFVVPISYLFLRNCRVTPFHPVFINRGALHGVRFQKTLLLVGFR
jgi:hypothetical protein